MEPVERFDLFVHNGEVWQSGDEEAVYAGPWPVRVYLFRHDLRNGAGAGINKLTKFGRIIEYYQTQKQHHEYTIYAVLLEVASASDYLQLNGSIEWDCWANQSNDYYKRPE